MHSHMFAVTSFDNLRGAVNEKWAFIVGLCVSGVHQYIPAVDWKRYANDSS